MGLVFFHPTSLSAEPPQAPAFSFDDTLVAPLRVHLLVSKSEPALCTTLAETDIRRIVGKVNKVWGQAGICFAVESIISEEPAESSVEVPEKDGDLRALVKFIPRETHAAELFNVYYIKSFGVNGVYFREGVFVKDTAALRKVEGGIDEPLPRVTSHELGHALGLPHRQDTFNLMASGTTGTLLNTAEVESTRAKAGTLPWIKRASDLLAMADGLAIQGKGEEARAIYRQLSGIAVEGETMARIRALLATDTVKSQD